MGSHSRGPPIQDEGFKRMMGKRILSGRNLVILKLHRTCNGVGQLKRECPNYLRGKGKAMSATLIDSKSSSSKSDDEADEDGNYTTFI